MIHIGEQGINYFQYTLFYFFINVIRRFFLCNRFLKFLSWTFVFRSCKSTFKNRSIWINTVISWLIWSLIWDMILTFDNVLYSIGNQVNHWNKFNKLSIFININIFIIVCVCEKPKFFISYNCLPINQSFHQCLFVWINDHEKKLSKNSFTFQTYFDKTDPAKQLIFLYFIWTKP